ncbi:hypothetical protein, unknown function [Leishmania donovani]|uniref:Uncharacterized protein n=1 Tax=Leishmania donovani TaxID=5661 RepID=E9BGQ5_LEIDO|nr:hypothetical protein, unknown function [Leishmania donovani]CBZ34431.1 hypothetical protein, unknown function [Leishmania donovani]
MRRHTPVPVGPLLPSRACALPPRAPPPPALHRTKTCLAYFCYGCRCPITSPTPSFSSYPDLTPPQRVHEKVGTAPHHRSIPLLRHPQWA